ncbi:C40 family peptidase [Dyella sp.]|uniref:C40 family peptidase n=1 Tax=Dyella sp. TaxID=1869338 RepID=UPI002850F169|nr:C40 family peptidase [Dyella sp.]MDR3446013.1 C40 family peptidase [Dyella sp.]
MKTRPLADAQRHALAEYPRESCGLVIIANGRERYVPCRNVAATPSDHFILSPQDYAVAEDLGEPVAIVHSHPDVPARPSEADMVACEASGLRWVIVSVMPGESGPTLADVCEFEPSGYEAPLVGRTFHHGVLDCWALCRDWYARERGIELPNPSRADDWWNDGASNLYSDAALVAAGFVQLTGAGDLEEGDLILMQVRSQNLVPNHAGVYVGDSLMLHHMPGRLSSRDVLGGYWRECARSYWRLAGPRQTD